MPRLQQPSAAAGSEEVALMDIQTFSAIIFLILLTAFLVWKRRHIQIQKLFFPLLYVAMYRTTLGLRQMDAWARRFPRMVRWFGVFSVGVGFLGMAAICVLMIHGLYALIASPAAAPGVS